MTTVDPTPRHLAETFDALTVAGLVVLADPDPVAVGQRRAMATDPGRARYVELCQWQSDQFRSRANPGGLAIIPAQGGAGSP